MCHLPPPASRSPPALHNAHPIIQATSTSAPPMASPSFQSASKSINDATPLAKSLGLQGAPGLDDSDTADRLRRSHRPHYPRILAKLRPQVSHSRGASTGLRNTPMIEAATSTVSPARSGPTPAAVPVGMTH